MAKNNFTRAELDAAYSQMTVFSDVLSQVFFKDSPEITQHILRIILDKPDLCVSKVDVQQEITNLFGHSVRFDVLATDSHNAFYNIEIQNCHSGELLWRADYYGAAIKMKHLQKKERYRNMPNVYVIFIVKDGSHCKGLPINRLLIRDDMGEIYDVGTRIYFVNGTLRNHTPLGIMMHDFSCCEASQMLDPVIAEHFEKIHQEKEKMDAIQMCMYTIAKSKALEIGRKEGFNDGHKEGFSEGRSSTEKTIVLHMLSQGMNESEIARCSGIHLDSVREIILNSAMNEKS